jgi:hypothetical protein
MGANGYAILMNLVCCFFCLSHVCVSLSCVERLLLTNQPTHTHTPAFQSRAGRGAGGLGGRGSVRAARVHSHNTGQESDLWQ